MPNSRSSEIPDFTNLGEEVTLPIDKIIPYWRNPRVISDEAVNAVAASIERFGYQQPVVVDAENVIIIGHTRTAAMRRLGYAEVPVIRVTDLDSAEVKQLRVVDNRAAEYGEWDYNALADEIADLDDDLVNGLVGNLERDEEQEKKQLDLELSEKSKSEGTADAHFICPTCFHAWDTTITEKDIAAGVITAKGN